jgi:hypothetical protein
MSIDTPTTRWSTNIYTTTTNTTSTSTLRAILQANRMLIGTDTRGVRIATLALLGLSIIDTSTERASTL